MGQSIAEFHPAFQWAINQVLAHCGAEVNSGFRTEAEQASLYSDYINGVPGQARAAAPGTSRHQGLEGGAVDLAGDLDCVASYAPQFGLTSIEGEPWHWQFTDEAWQQVQDGTYMFESDAPQEPEDSLENIREMLLGHTEGDAAPDVPARVAEAFAADDPPPSDTPTGPGGLSDAEAAQVMAQAGFSGEALVTALAVAIGESGLNPAVPGPTIAADGTLGRPQGLFQIREDSRQTGTGGWRDGEKLYSPLFNAKAAYAISNGGTNWQPWEVFTSGAYQGNVERARAAVAQLGSAAFGHNGAPPASVEPSDDMGIAEAFHLTDAGGVSSEIADMILAQRQTDPVEKAGLKRGAPKSDRGVFSW